MNSCENSLNCFGTTECYKTPKNFSTKIEINFSTTIATDSISANGICTLYFKLLYLILSNFAQHKVHTLIKWYCKHLKIKLEFSFFKSKNLMKATDLNPDHSALMLFIGLLVGHKLS